MKNNLKITIAVITAVTTILAILGLSLLLTQLEWYIKLALYIALCALTICIYITMLLGKPKLCKSAFLFHTVIVIVLAIFFILNISGIFESLDDMEKIKAIILKSGGWGIAICFLLVIFNVVVLPAPAVIFFLAITAVYSSWIAFLICYTATLIGSLIAFYIGRLFGKNAVAWCIGKDDTEKYSNLLNKKGKVPFIIMQLLPFFPDDILCMVAGLSNMSIKFFSIVMILVKPIYIAFVCFLGTGNIIPFKGWGIGVWVAIFVVIIGLCILYLVYQNKIDNWLKSKFIKNKDIAIVEEGCDNTAENDSVNDEN